MSEEDAGSPCYQAKGSPRTQDASTTSPYIYPMGLDSATPHKRSTSTVHTVRAGDHVVSSTFTARARRPNAGGFAIYAFVVATILYLAANVAAALIGWHNTAMAAGAVVWVIVCAWSWADAQGRLAGRR